MTQRKWIKAELGRLDPGRDWLRILHLSTSYHLNSFLAHFAYVTTVPSTSIAQRGA